MVCLISICTSRLHALEVCPHVRVDARLVVVLVGPGVFVGGVLPALCRSAEVVLLAAGVRRTVQEGN